MLSVAFAIALALQFLLVSIFALKVQKNRKASVKWEEKNISEWPYAEVILCLRGVDSTLTKLLSSLSRQNYKGQWQLSIVIDSQEDEAWKVVNDLITSFSYRQEINPSWSNVKIQPLRDKPKKGSRKSASLLQAFNELNQSSSLISIIDSDADISESWLQTLALGCCQKNIGAVSGNRWFIPRKNSLTGWTRAVWNAGAIVMMTILDIPWGGSLAVRREVIDHGLWTNLLEHSLCEDTSLIKPLREMKLKYFYSPNLLIVDRSDEISMSELSRWIARQILTARLHHHSWPIIMFHGLSTSFLLLIGLANNAWLSIFFYELGCLGLLVWIEIVAREGKVSSLQRWMLALFPGQLVNGWSTLKAMLSKKVEWRGIIYQVTLKPRGVEVLKAPASTFEGLASTDSDLSH